MGTINKNKDLPVLPPGAPGMFRCNKPGMMKMIFENTGFKNIQVHEVTATLNAGTIDIYWNMMTEIGAPIVAAMSKAEDTMCKKIKNEVFELISNRYPAVKLAIEAVLL